MGSYETMPALVEAIANKGWLAGPPVSAVYASAGADTYQYTFLRPEFLERRGVGQVPAPNVFVLVDHHEQPAPGFADPATRIETLETKPVRASGIDMRLAHVRHISNEWGERDLAVLTAKADNRKVQPIWHREGWIPELFIGVCDGCNWGGNPHQWCVNRLDVPPGMSESEAAAVAVPRWWITDHFSDAKPYAEIGRGDTVESTDPRFPFTYRKLALLSSEWGRYGGPVMGGATLFEVMRRDGQPTSG